MHGITAAKHTPRRILRRIGLIDVPDRGVDQFRLDLRIADHCLDAGADKFRRGVRFAFRNIKAPAGNPPVPGDSLRATGPYQFRQNWYRC